MSSKRCVRKQKRIMQHAQHLCNYLTLFFLHHLVIYLGGLTLVLGVYQRQNLDLQCGCMMQIVSMWLLVNGMFSLWSVLWTVLSWACPRPDHRPYLPSTLHLIPHILHNLGYRLFLSIYECLMYMCISIYIYIDMSLSMFMPMYTYM